MALTSSRWVRARIPVAGGSAVGSRSAIRHKWLSWNGVGRVRPGRTTGIWCYGLIRLKGSGHRTWIMTHTGSTRSRSGLCLGSTTAPRGYITLISSNPSGCQEACQHLPRRRQALRQLPPHQRIPRHPQQRERPHQPPPAHQPTRRPVHQL